MEKAKLRFVVAVALGLALGPIVAAPWSGARAADEYGRLMGEGEAARAAGRFPAAEARFREALTVKGQSVEALFALGLVLGYQKKYTEAGAVLGRAHDLVPADADVALALARLRFWQGKLQDAARQVAPVVARHPDNLEARLLAARLDLFLHRLEGAKAGFRAVIAADPKNTEAYLGLGDALAVSERGAALDAYRQALKLDPNSEVARKRIAGLTRPKAAPPSAAKPEPRAADALAGMMKDGMAARVAGRFAEAEGLFRKVVDLRPDSVEALTNLALALGYQGRSAEGLPVAARAARFEPANTDVMIAQARLSAWSGDTASARALLDRVLAAAPNNPEAQGFAARVAYYQQRFDDAEAGFRAVLAAEPENIEALVGLGDVQAVRGDGEAAETYRRALEIRPDLADVRERRERLVDPSGFRWRLDIGDDMSTFPAGYGRPDWQDSFARLSYAVDARTRIRGRFERSDRFDRIDRYYEAGVEHRFTPWLLAHVDLGVTPAAQFLPRQRLDTAGSVRVREGDGWLGSTMATLGYRYANYTSGPVARLAPGVQQYFLAGRLWLTAELPFTRDETDRDDRGWSARADIQPWDWLRLFGGAGSGSETIANSSAKTSSRFVGVTVSLSERFDLTGSVSREDTVNQPPRKTLGVGLTSRF